MNRFHHENTDCKIAAIALKNIVSMEIVAPSLLVDSSDYGNYC